jgi:hypothetical protein
MKGAFTIGAAARELVPLRSLEQRITYALAGAVQHLALHSDYAARFTGRSDRVIFEGQGEAEEWTDGL